MGKMNNLIYAIDNATIDSEVDVLQSIAESYSKILSIMEYSSVDDNDIESTFFQEGKILDEATGKGKDENILVKIIKFIPRFIIAIINVIKTKLNNAKSKKKKTNMDKLAENYGDILKDIKENGKKSKIFKSIAIGGGAILTGYGITKGALTLKYKISKKSSNKAILKDFASIPDDVNSNVNSNHSNTDSTEIQVRFIPSSEYEIIESIEDKPQNEYEQEIIDVGYRDVDETRSKVNEIKKNVRNKQKEEEIKSKADEIKNNIHNQQKKEESKSKADEIKNNIHNQQKKAAETQQVQPEISISYNIENCVKAAEKLYEELSKENKDPESLIKDINAFSDNLRKNTNTKNTYVYGAYEKLSEAFCKAFGKLVTPLEKTAKILSAANEVEALSSKKELSKKCIDSLNFVLSEIESFSLVNDSINKIISDLSEVTTDGFKDKSGSVINNLKSTPLTVATVSSIIKNRNTSSYDFYEYDAHEKLIKPTKDKKSKYVAINNRDLGQHAIATSSKQYLYPNLNYFNPFNTNVNSKTFDSAIYEFKGKGPMSSDWKIIPCVIDGKGKILSKGKIFEK